MGKKSSLTEVLRAQIVTVHGEGYTERDISAKLRYSKTAMHNAIVKLMALFVTVKGVVVHGKLCSGMTTQ